MHALLNDFGLDTSHFIEIIINSIESLGMSTWEYEVGCNRIRTRRESTSLNILKDLIAPTASGVVAGLIVAIAVWLAPTVWERLRRILRIGKPRKGKSRPKMWIVVTTGLCAFMLGFLVAFAWSSKPISTHCGKPVPNGKEFLVQSNFHPSGLMGDIGDVSINRQSDVDRFTYDVKGRGPHEWDYKYVHCRLDSMPARFAGVIYLDPPNNFGEARTGGYDLRGFRRLKWEARCLTGEVYTEFVVGGVNWKWNDTVACPQTESTPFPCSMPRTSLGIKRLTADWQPFEYEFSADLESQLCRVVGGFAWTIAPTSNGVTWDLDRPTPNVPAVFSIELRGIRYERN